MPRRSWVILVMSAMLCVWVQFSARAQTTRPATDPVVDLSTPRAALLSLNMAMREGDVPTIKRLFLAATPAEEEMIEADAQMAAALADLRRSAIKSFGEEGAKTITGDTGEAAAKSVARIDGAEITIHGNTATVIYPDQKDAPFILKKVKDQWRVPVGELGKPLDAATLEQRLADLSVQRKVVREIVDQIRSGKFTNAEQAREVWQTKILQATSQPASPAHGDRPVRE